MSGTPPMNGSAWLKVAVAGAVAIAAVLLAAFLRDLGEARTDVKRSRDELAALTARVAVLEAIQNKCLDK